MTRGWAGDPRHFRMIVSAEDGEALGDLKPFIREVMAVKRSPTCPHRKLENPASDRLVGLVATGRSISVIGALFPIAPCG
ncbi:MAG: hypothetical protein ABL956_13835, partial [Hyphomonadaceae bacterium]